jgi:putative membrane protein
MEDTMQRHTWALVLAYGLLVGCGKSAASARNTEIATPANQQFPTTSSTEASSANTTPSSPIGDARAAENGAPAGASIAQQDAAKSPADSRLLTDTEIAGVTEAANASEIEQAKIAQRKAKNPEVKRFAGMMLMHHQQAQTDLARLGIKTADSPVSIQLDTASASTLDLLKNATGDFDRVYIDSQVEAHRNVIALIDSQLLPSAKEPSLRAYLQKVRNQVEAHLQQAETQQQTLSAMANARRSGSSVAKGKSVASAEGSAK